MKITDTMRGRREMKKTERRWMWKRALSMLLVCAMLFTSADLTVLAVEPDAGTEMTVSDAGTETVSGEDIETIVPDEENADQDVAEDDSAASVGIEQETFSVKAKNDIGSLFVDGMQEAVQNEQAALVEEYAISDIQVSGVTATVTFHAVEDCSVVISVYEEGSQKPYAFGSAPAASAGGKVEVTIETGQMPEYFELKAYLVETDSLRPLSKEFYSRLYTQEIQFVENLTVNDFDPELVVNLDEDETTNFIAFEEDVIIVRETLETNKLIAYDDVSNAYSFENADATIKGLKEGDIFVYYDLDKQVKIIQVKALNFVNNTPAVNRATEDSETQNSDKDDSETVNQDVEEAETQKPDEENSETVNQDEEGAEVQKPDDENSETPNHDEEDPEVQNSETEDVNTDDAYAEAETEELGQDDLEIRTLNTGYIRKQQAGMHNVVGGEIQKPDTDEEITDDQPITDDKTDGEDIENQETEDKDSDKQEDDDRKNDDRKNDSEQSGREDIDIRETDTAANVRVQSAEESVDDQEIIAQIVAADMNNSAFLEHVNAIKIEESLSNTDIKKEFLDKLPPVQFEGVEVQYTGRERFSENYEFDTWNLKAESDGDNSGGSNEESGEDNSGGSNEGSGEDNSGGSNEGGGEDNSGGSNEGSGEDNSGGSNEGSDEDNSGGSDEGNDNNDSDDSNGDDGDNKGEVSSSIELDLTVSFAFEADFKYYRYKPWDGEQIDYASCLFMMDTRLSGSLSVQAEFSVPLFPSLPELESKFVEIKYIPEFVVGGKISLNVKGTQIKDTYRLIIGPDAPVKQGLYRDEPIREPGEFNVEAEAYVGVKWEPEIKVEVADFEILDVGGEIGIELALTKTTDLFSPEDHPCNSLCTAYKVFFRVPFSITLHLCGKDVLDEWFPDAPLPEDGYLADILLFSAYKCNYHKEFGAGLGEAGRCPRISKAVKKVVVEVQDEEGIPLSGAVVSTNVSNTQVATNNKGLAEMEVPAGVCYFSAVYFRGASSYRGSTRFTVSDSDAKVLIRLKKEAGKLPSDEYVTQIDRAGDIYTLVTESHSLYTWGDNRNGAIGNGSADKYQYDPVKVLDNVKKVALDKSISNCVAAVTYSGQLYMWGDNSKGQLGLGDSNTYTKSSPTQVMIPNDGQDSQVDKVVIYGSTVAAILKNGDLYMWGDNSSGRLGTGDYNVRYSPCHIMEGVKVKDIKISSSVTAVLTTDGKVYTWGNPTTWNTLGDGSRTERYTPDLDKPLLENVKSIELSDYNGAAIQKDGSLYVWGCGSVVGSTGDLKKIENIPPVKNVLLEYQRNYSGAGDEWILVQTEADRLYTWGDNSFGQLGDTSGTSTTPRLFSTVSDIKEVYTMVGEQESNVADYAILSMALTTTGDLWIMGRAGGPASPIKVATNVEKVSQCARGNSECFLVMKDGSLWTFYGTVCTKRPSQALQRFYWNKYNVAAVSTYAFAATEDYVGYAADTGEEKIMSYSGLLPNELYNFYVMKSESAETALSNDNLLYIAQGVADGEGNLSFSYVMREEYQSPDVFIRGRSKADIADATITIGTDGVLDYNGEEQYVKPIVIYDGKQLIEGKDYYLSGDFMAKEVGRYTVNVIGIGLYSGSKSVEYRITDGNESGGGETPGEDDDPDNPSPDPVYGEVLKEDVPADGNIPEGLWIAGVSEAGYDYTGRAIKPEVRVYDHKKRLAEKTDYMIAYKNNTKAYGYTSDDQAFEAKKAPTITVTGKGNYTGKETQTFRILPLDISVKANAPDGTGTEADSVQTDDNVFAADNMTITANKKNQKPVPALMWNDKKLKNNTDYTITYYDSTGVKKLDYVKEAGNYYIELTGKGNFTGTRRVNLTVIGQSDQLKLMSKMTVAKIPNQSYTGSAIEPALTVKDGKTTLNKDEHYTVSYSLNKEIGTAYAVVTGIEAKGYSGTKRVSFKITGGSVSKATVTGLAGQTFVYGGVNKEPELTVSMKVAGVEKTLEKGTNYKVTWQKNRDAGTATAMITGVGGYTGTLKKTFKIQAFDIAANADGRFTAVLTQDEVPYAKGGTKPEVAVTFLRDNGTTQKLQEGKDYTLSYKNHTTLNDGSRADKLPTVTIKGKGNFKGTYGTKLIYKITTQDLGSLTLTAADKTYQNKKNIFATKVTITDLNGKVLKAGTDYEKVFTYAYKNETTLGDETVRAAGAAVDKNDIIPAGTVLEVRVSAKGSYTGTKTGEYRIAQASIASASVSIPKQTYTGQAITPDKDQITVKIKGKPVDASQYEIVPGSYKNNVKKGTASVTIRGVDNYGGTKTVKFTIRAKGFLWWWRKG